MANFGVRLTLCLTMWPAIFADNAKGNRIMLTDLRDDLDGIGGRGIDRLRPVLNQARQQEIQRGNAAGRIEAAATSSADCQDGDSDHLR
jgi:hypothetical protein